MTSFHIMRLRTHLLPLWMFTWNSVLAVRFAGEVASYVTKGSPRVFEVLKPYPKQSQYSDNDAELDPERAPRNHITFERVKTIDPSDIKGKEKLVNRNQKNSSKISSHFIHLKQQLEKTENETKESREVEKVVGQGRYLETPVDYDGVVSRPRYFPEWENQAAPSPGPWVDDGWNRRYPVNVMSNSLQQEMILMEVLQEKVRANKTADDNRGFHNNLMEMLGKSKFSFYLIV